MAEKTYELKDCPFCGSDKIGFSAKVASRKRNEANFHVAAYCKDCNCYGPRILVKIKSDKNYPQLNDKTMQYKLAADAWNNRKE